jgi:hypothetical protein
VPLTKHLWIPDTQVRKGVPTDHIEALGNYILEKQPDVIVIAGDWWDMPATSRWNSVKEQEGLRIIDDIEAGNKAMDLLWKPLYKYQEMRARNKQKVYRPERHFLFGNHEHHIERFADNNPVVEKLLGYHLLNVEKHGLIQHKFLHPVDIDDIWYCHYFYNPNSGKPYGGMVETRLKNIGHSFTQGHTQGLLCGTLIRPNGRVDRGLVAGSFYQHDEGYKGPQGNHHFQGVIMKHEVKKGYYDMMEVSVDFLRRKYL